MSNLRNILQSKDKQTPKTLQQYIIENCPRFKKPVFTVDMHLGAEQQYESVIDPIFKNVIVQTWNAATEATRAEYDDKIKAMQAEIDKRDYLLKLVLEDFKNLRLGVIEENDPEINHTTELIEKELNQRGEDE